MLQNGQLMGPITIMTQPNNFAVSKSPPQQTSPSTSTTSSHPGGMPLHNEGSPKLEVCTSNDLVLYSL